MLVQKALVTTGKWVEHDMTLTLPWACNPYHTKKTIKTFLGLFFETKRTRME